MEAIYEFQFTESFLLTSVLRYREQIWWRRPFIKYKWPIAAIAIAVLISGFFYSKIIAATAGGVFGAVVLGWPIDVLIIKSRFRKSSYYNDKINLRISNQGLEVIGRNSKSNLQWNVFTKALRFRDGLMLLHGPYLYDWLPDEAARDSNTVQNAIKLIRTHVNDYRNT